MADLGNGSTLTFGTSGFTASINEMNPDPITRAVVDTTHLGTTGGRTKTPGKVTDSGGDTITIQYNPDEQPPFNGAAETITTTYPVPSGDTSGATAACTGFIDSWTRPTLTVDGLMISTIHITYSGDWTFTDAS